MDKLRNVTRRSKLGLWVTVGLVVLAVIAGTGTAIASMGGSSESGKTVAPAPEVTPDVGALALVDSTSTIGGAGNAGGAAGTAGGGAAGGGGSTIKVAQYN